jgi:hypothetical protein
LSKVIAGTFSILSDCALIIKHYLIDSGRGFETKISKGLSANKKKAMQQIKQRFARHKDQWVANAKREK